MKKTDPRTEQWLKRAKSNMAFVRTGKISSDILYEDLCFEAQQAAEKALKIAENVLTWVEKILTKSKLLTKPKKV